MRKPEHGPYWRAVEKFPVLRQSTLSAFDSCALASKFEADFRNGWSTHPQARGTAFHKVAAECMRTMSEHGEMTIPVDVALAHLHEVLRQDGVDRVCPHCGSDKIRRGIKAGNRTCGSCGRRFASEMANLPLAEVKDLYWVTKKWAHDNAWDIANLMDVEERLTVPIAYPDGKGGSVLRMVTGQMDVVFSAKGDPSHAIVVDYKDTFGLPAPTDISFEGYFQQRMYGWLMMRTYPSIKSVTLREFYVRFSEPREVTLWREDLDDVEQEFIALVERFDKSIHRGVFTPTPGKHCGWCMRPADCTIPTLARDIGRIRTQKEAEVIAKELVVAEAAVKQAKGQLKVWTNVHGATPLKNAKGRYEIGYRETETETRPSREELEKAQREAGDAGHLQIDKLYRKTKGTRFDQHAVPRTTKPTDEDAATLASLEGALVAAREEKGA